MIKQGKFFDERDLHDMFNDHLDDTLPEIEVFGTVFKGSEYVDNLKTEDDWVKAFSEWLDDNCWLEDEDELGNYGYRKSNQWLLDNEEVA